MSQAVHIEQDNGPIQVETYLPEGRRALSFSNGSLQGVTATGAGTSIYVGDQGVFMLIVSATNVTSGGVVLLEGCRKDSKVDADWYTIGTITVTANKSYYLQVLEDEWHTWVRSNLTTRTDGTYSTYWGMVPRRNTR